MGTNTRSCTSIQGPLLLLRGKKKKRREKRRRKKKGGKGEQDTGGRGKARDQASALHGGTRRELR